MAHSHLHNLLTNPFYAGRLHWADLDVEGKHPPLVSLAVFEKVQAVIQHKYRNPGTKDGAHGFPLRGLAMCASCRGNMTGERHDGRWGYYRCGRNAYRKDLCRARFCNTDRAHQDLQRLCTQVRLSRGLAEAIRKEAIRLIEGRVSTAQHERERVEAEQGRLLEQEMRLTQAFTSGDVSPEAYRRQTGDLRTSRAKLIERRTRSHVTREALTAKVDDTLKLATSLSDLYAQCPDAKRSELLRAVFSAIVLSHEGVTGFTLKPPFDRFAQVTATADGQSPKRVQRLAEAVIDAA